MVLKRIFLVVYGFYDECKRRTNTKIWRTFIDAFNALPIAALVAGKIFCVHGGLSPSLNSLDDVRNIVRPTDVPEYGLLSDLLWADPSETANDWEDSERGVSYCFGKRVVNNFLAKFDLDLVCRAHMVTVAVNILPCGSNFFNFTFRSWKMDMNFSTKGLLSRYSQRPTIAENSITLEQL